MESRQVVEVSNLLKQAQLAVDELFAELGKKRAGDWGIINDGLLALKKAQYLLNYSLELTI